MGVFQRISDIITANLSEVAEQYEEPERMLKQAVREMEAALRQATQEAARALSAERRLATELAENQRRVEAWQHRAELAVKEGDDDLARQALTRQREHERIAEALRHQWAAARDAGATLRQQWNEMKEQLAEAKRTLATLSARQRAAKVRKKIYLGLQESSETSVGDEAFRKFERMRERVEQAEAEAEALAELLGAEPEPSEVVGESRSALDDIESRLRALKVGMQQN